MHYLRIRSSEQTKPLFAWRHASSTLVCAVKPIMCRPKRQKAVMPAGRLEKDLPDLLFYERRPTPHPVITFQEGRSGGDSARRTEPVRSTTTLAPRSLPSGC